jgi:hypothetical protein
MSTRILAWTSPLVLAALAAGSPPRKVQISGSAELTYAKQESAPVAAGEGHVLLLGTTSGVNRNTGGTDYFADAQVSNVETADLTQGNGSHQGYYTMTKNGSSATAKWQGTVRTVLGEDQQPRTSFSGTWEYVQGTGEYAGIRGKGTYEGRFLAQDRYTVSWKGQYAK